MRGELGHNTTRLVLLVMAVSCADSDAADSSTTETSDNAAAIAGTSALDPGMRTINSAATSANSSAAGTSGATTPMTTGTNPGSNGAAGASNTAAPTGGTAGAAMARAPLTLSIGTCCAGGTCLCRGAPPSELRADTGPHATQQYAISEVGCVFYPTDAQPPFAAVALADGFGGSGGCDSVQTGQWGPLYASHGMVALLVETGSGDQPSLRGEALSAAIRTLKAEQDRPDSPLFGKLAGRYGTSGFSMGGGGTTYAAQTDPSLLSSVAIMPWGHASSGAMVPTLIVCGQSDGIAPCTSHGAPAYQSLAASVPKMRVTISSAHNGQPSAGEGASGAYVLAFQKLFLEGDERWRPLLAAAMADETTIR